MLSRLSAVCNTNEGTPKFLTGTRGHMSRRGAGGCQFDPGQRWEAALPPNTLVTAEGGARGAVHLPFWGRSAHAVLVFVLAAEEPTVGHNIGLNHIATCSGGMRHKESIRHKLNEWWVEEVV
ncbi:hypothetical protein CEXT_1471 [Caerostris extrusa]|uniref:Uncharacterized protein n=1 Tax=Caerostris extrusa TaxID=172846 RepID=A0AAV4SSJ3_CAEEX|nr:hypothetical protein CEXT_1471 [Caerostris extrusa]